MPKQEKPPRNDRVLGENLYSQNGNSTSPPTWPNPWFGDGGAGFEDEETTSRRRRSIPRGDGSSGRYWQKGQTMSNKPSFKSHDSYASSTESPSYDFGKAPRVGQSKPYVSGSNAHGRHEKPRGNVSGGPEMPYAERDVGAGGGKRHPKSSR